MGSQDDLGETEVRRLGRSGDRHARIATCARLPKDVHEALRIAAEDRGVSMNWLICRAVAEYLDRLVPVEEMLLTRD
jgi:predicted HicB family RNase H-like nuclease